MSLLSIESLTRNFGGVKALNGVTLSIEKGGIKALVGPNGAGKTTLFNAISGFVAVDKGTVTFENENITGLSAEKISQRGLKRTFQNSSGFVSMNVWENLMVSAASQVDESPLRILSSRRSIRHSQHQLSKNVDEILEQICLMEIRDRLLIDLTMAELRFVEMARQLLNRPSMLMLDEPAAGFGPDKIELLGKIIRQVSESGVTVLLIEHNLPFVLELADYAYVLANGTLLKEGTPAEAFSDETVIRNYIGEGVSHA